MFFIAVEDVVLDPVHIGVFGGVTVVFESNLLSYNI